MNRLIDAYRPEVTNVEIPVAIIQEDPYDEDVAELLSGFQFWAWYDDDRICPDPQPAWDQSSCRAAA